MSQAMNWQVCHCDIEQKTCEDYTSRIATLPVRTEADTCKDKLHPNVSVVISQGYTLQSRCHLTNSDRNELRECLRYEQLRKEQPPQSSSP
eukprot:2383878-Amphidinium_carterae.1